MSTFEQIFFDPGELSVEEAGDALASTLNMRRSDDHGDVALTGRPFPSDLPVEIRGLVGRNVYAETDPQSVEEESIFDPFPMLFEVRTSKADVEHQERAALLLFQKVVEEIGWPSVLTHRYSILVATYNRFRGLRTFPPGTSSEGTDKHLWQ